MSSWNMEEYNRNFVNILNNKIILQHMFAFLILINNKNVYFQKKLFKMSFYEHNIYTEHTKLRSRNCIKHQLHENGTFFFCKQCIMSYFPTEMNCVLDFRSWIFHKRHTPAPFQFDIQVGLWRVISVCRWHHNLGVQHWNKFFKLIISQILTIIVWKWI